MPVQRRAVVTHWCSPRRFCCRTGKFSSVCQRGIYDHFRRLDPLQTQEEHVIVHA